MASQADLVRTVLENLGVLAVGQSVTAEDSDAITRRLASKVADLNARAICFIPDTDDFEDAYLLPLAAIMAAECATAFGMSGQKKAELDAGVFPAEETLRDIVRPRGARQMLQVEPMGVRRYGGRWW